MKMYFLLKRGIFQCHDSFRGCTLYRSGMCWLYIFCLREKERKSNPASNQPQSACRCRSYITYYTSIHLTSSLSSSLAYESHIRFDVQKQSITILFRTTVHHWLPSNIHYGTWKALRTYPNSKVPPPKKN